jgi:hypothetical protein
MPTTAAPRSTGLEGCAAAPGPVRGRMRLRAVTLLVVVTAVSGLVRADGPRPGDGRISLSTVEGSPATTSESTIVELPLVITLKPPGDRTIGTRLRLSVFFSWNNVRFEDITGGDLEASLRTLTVVPGIELLVPVGDRWMVRPYAQIGGLDALGMDGHRFMASVGSRANTRWDFDRWILSAGGRFEYTTVLDEDLHRTDDVAFVDLGADFSFPLWFDIGGERAAAGVFIIPRAYLNSAELVGQDGFDLGVDSHVELGASFQLHDKPKLWFAKLPSWYGIGVRLSEQHRSLRLYLGFPF